MRSILRLILAVMLGLGAGACASAPKDGVAGGIPSTLQPHGGKSGARAAGFGAAGAFVK